MARKLSAAIIGATGMAGQQFVLALDQHPWFEVTTLVTSKTVASYEEALLESSGASRWIQIEPIPSNFARMPVVNSDDFNPTSVDVIFTAVESDLAKQLEPRFAKTTPVFSTASAFRYEEDTPILLPGVNIELSSMLERQRAGRGWKGFVAPGPNCTVTGLAMALKPLYDRFGIRNVLMVSMQSMSGAGRSPGVRGLDIVDNVIPYIPKEEGKVRAELGKILGVFDNERLLPSAFDVNCICTRVGVIDGHTEAVFVGLDEPASIDDVRKAWQEFQPHKEEKLPSAPTDWVFAHSDPYRPQPRLDRNHGDGMTTVVGRLELEPVLGGVKFVLVSHNTRIGAAKGSVLTAEALHARGVF